VSRAAFERESALGSHGVDGTTPDGDTEYQVDVEDHCSYAKPDEGYPDEVGRRP